MKKFKILILILFLASALFAQEQVRIMCYNLLKYPDNEGSNRNKYFKTVIETAQPDILVAEEMYSTSGVNSFLSNVLGSKFKAAPFSNANGGDTDNALFYKDSLFTYLGLRRINSWPRKISEFKVVHKIAGDTLIIYAVHLKASSGTDNENDRKNSATNLLNVTKNFRANQYYIVLGDFNMYSSNEPAYQKLMNTSTPGHFIDPINATGNWHNSSTFRFIHTQSTRTTNLSDGGVPGGLDDRFDMILVSPSVKNKGGITIDVSSYKAFGNDGNHFNKSINYSTNTAVGNTVATALYYASDHLPVLADFEFDVTTDVVDVSYEPTGYKLYQNYPNPFNPTTTIRYTIPNLGMQNSLETQNFTSVQLKIYNALGEEIATLVNENKAPGSYTIRFDGSNLSSGVYFYSLHAEDIFITKKFVLLK